MVGWLTDYERVVSQTLGILKLLSGEMPEEVSMVTQEMMSYGKENMTYLPFVCTILQNTAMANEVKRYKIKNI